MCNACKLATPVRFKCKVSAEHGLLSNLCQMPN
jgi:hypothetical protein